MSERNVERDNKKCRYCRLEMDQAARVCHHCGRHQSRLLNLAGNAQLLGIVASLLLVALAFMQFSEARRERIEATIAVENALLAQQDARTAASLAEEAQAEAEAINQALRSQVLSIVSSIWLSVVTRNEFGTERSSQAQVEILQELDRLAEAAIPDTAEREDWIRNLLNRLPTQSE